MKKSSIIKGTLILTCAGLLTRIIGFLYRIFLSNTLGAEQLGIYQLIFPVYGICHTIYASGIQTAISKLTAEENADGKSTRPRRILLCGLILSTILAVTVSLVLYINAERIAISFLKEASCTPSLRILALAFPFCGISSCINGYCYGKNKATIPAVTQIAEQLVRVASVFLISMFMGNGSAKVSCELATFGIMTGELASNLISFSVLLFPLWKRKRLSRTEPVNRTIIPSPLRNVMFRLIKFATPLSLNRLLLSLLHSFEAIMIPFLLRKSGMNTSESLSEYGIINGMALPFVYFASAITNALAVLLLPSVSEDDASGNKKRIAITVSRSISATLLLGIFCNVMFVLFGPALGTTIFHENAAGTYIRILSCLCPFLYLTTTLNSILNGLGKTSATFVTSMIGSLLRITLLYLLTPRLGIAGCFISLLFSQLVLCASDLILVFHYTDFRMNLYHSLLRPLFIAALTGFLSYRLYQFLIAASGTDSLPASLGCCAGFAFVYLFFCRKNLVF